MKKIIISFIFGALWIVFAMGIFSLGLIYGERALKEVSKLPFVGDYATKILPYQSKTIENEKVNLPVNILGDEPVVAVAEEASKGVVTVSIKKKQLLLDPFSFDDFFNFPFGGGRLNQQQEKEIQQDIGSGFVVGGGLVITNKHVVSDDKASYKIIDRNDKEYEVEDIYRDPANDLAILKVKGLSVPSLPLGDSSQIRVGQTAIAIGTALGEFRHTVTTGVISGLGRGITAGDTFGRSQEELEGVIQTSAAINPGNSGGPLLNVKGEVIGVNVAVAGNAQNIGFAIPINVVKSSLDNFNSTGQFERPMLGVRYQVITQKAALVNEVPQGAYIVEVVANSSAEKAGIKEGDIIAEFDGKQITEKNSLSALINSKKVGDTVQVRVYDVEKKEYRNVGVVLDK